VSPQPLSARPAPRAARHAGVRPPPDLALRTATSMIESLRDGYDVRLAGADRLSRAHPLPCTLDGTGLCFSFRRTRG
jgi:hypothetical protein